MGGQTREPVIFRYGRVGECEFIYLFGKNSRTAGLISTKLSVVIRITPDREKRKDFGCKKKRKKSISGPI